MAWQQVDEVVKEGLRAVNLEEMQAICTEIITEFDISYKEELQSAPLEVVAPLSTKMISSKKTSTVSRPSPRNPSPRLPQPDDSVEKERRKLDA